MVFLKKILLVYHCLVPSLILRFAFKLILPPETNNSFSHFIRIFTGTKRMWFECTCPSTQALNLAAHWTIGVSNSIVIYGWNIACGNFSRFSQPTQLLMCSTQGAEAGLEEPVGVRKWRGDKMQVSAQAPAPPDTLPRAGPEGCRDPLGTHGLPSGPPSRPRPSSLICCHHVLSGSSVRRAPGTSLEIGSVPPRPSTCLRGRNHAWWWGAKDKRKTGWGVRMVLARGEEGTGSSRMQRGVGGGHRGLIPSSFCLRSKQWESAR